MMIYLVKIHIKQIFPIFLVFRHCIRLFRADFPFTLCHLSPVLLASGYFAIILHIGFDKRFLRLRRNIPCKKSPKVLILIEKHKTIIIGV